MARLNYPGSGQRRRMAADGITVQLGTMNDGCAKLKGNEFGSANNEGDIALPLEKSVYGHEEPWIFKCK